MLLVTFTVLLAAATSASIAAGGAAERASYGDNLRPPFFQARNVVDSTAFDTGRARPASAAAGEDAGRSLALVRADPSGGQSVFEATNGVHYMDICDSSTVSSHEFYFQNLYFCNYANETTPFVGLPWRNEDIPIEDRETTGIRTACPATKEGCRALGLSELGLESCLELCSEEPCSDDLSCQSGMFGDQSFCAIMPGQDEGTCIECPTVDDCIGFGKLGCSHCSLYCPYYNWGDFTVEGESFWAEGLYDPRGSVSGPLVDCSDLVLEKAGICPGAKDSICLIQDDGGYSRGYSQLARKCKDSGGLAVVLYLSDTERSSDDIPPPAYFPDAENFPVIRISFDSGISLKDKRLGSIANVTTYPAGEVCYRGEYCASNCIGSHYAGANTQAKRNALVWVPRVTAILSGLCSLMVLVDAVKVNNRRGKLFYQLMAQMSFFDIVGSAAYAFTSLPIDSSEYSQTGARGTWDTCIAQGFFIQLGTIACFTNVSLAFYYFFVIQKGWSETRLMEKRRWFFVCPIIVGVVFAGFGIPFYGNMLLWCNNSALWWPDIPVAIAILVATLVMGSVCWDVRKKQRASDRWRQGGGGGGGDSLSKKVFWQSVWYLLAFYMTWPPYLALQYSWASGREYNNFGFILYAGTVVPLQGVWNFFVYVRNRQLRAVRERASRQRARVRSFIYRTTIERFSKRPSSTQAPSETQGPSTQNPSAANSTQDHS